MLIGLRAEVGQLMQDVIELKKRLLELEIVVAGLARIDGKEAATVEEEEHFDSLLGQLHRLQAAFVESLDKRRPNHRRAYQIMHGTSDREKKEEADALHEAQEEG